MRIKITRSFWDKEDPKARKPVPIGKVMPACAERGQYLIDIGLAEAVPEKTAVTPDPE